MGERKMGKITRDALVLGAATCALLYAFAPSATAQSTQPATPDPATPNPAGGSPASSKTLTRTSTTGKIEEVVVTATRRSEKLSKVAVSVTALGATALKERSITTETDLQSSVPGLTVKTGESSNEFDYAIRGQTTDAFSGSPPGVLPYLNEVPLAPHTEAGSSFYDLSSVQVLKGPQGTLFGRNDTGGAVLYTTNQPGPFGGYITQRIGDYSYYETLGAINLPIVPDQLSIRLAADSDNRTGYVKVINQGTTLGNQDRISGRATILWTPSVDFKNTLLVQYSKNDDSDLEGELAYVNQIGQTNGGVPLNDTGALIYGNALNKFLQQQKAQGYLNADLSFTPHTDAHGLFVEDTASYNLSPDIQIKNIVGYTSAVTDEQATLGGSPFGLLDIYDNNSRYDGNHFNQDDYSEEFQVQGKAVDGQLKYIVGFYRGDVTVTDASAGTVGSDLPHPAAQFYYDAKTTDDSTAVFAQGTYDLSRLTTVSGLSFTGGVRYTWEDLTSIQLPRSLFYVGSSEQKASESNPSWQVGLQYQVTPEELLYVVTRGSWRAGGYNNVTPPTNNLDFFRDETTHDVEVGSKFSGLILGTPVQANLALYDQIVKNAERDVFFEIDGAPSSQTTNIPEGETKGVEFDGQMRPVPWLTLGIGFSYTYAEWTQPDVEVGGSLVRATNYADTPRWAGSISGTAELPAPEDWGHMTMHADTYVQTDEFFSNFYYTATPGTRFSGYSVTNLRYDWTSIMNSRFSLGLFMKNVFDRHYFIGGFAVGPDVGVETVIPGMPRTFGGELTFKF